LDVDADVDAESLAGTFFLKHVKRLGKQPLGRCGASENETRFSDIDSTSFIFEVRIRRTDNFEFISTTDALIIILHRPQKTQTH